MAGAEPYGPKPTVGDVIAFGDTQTAALDQANGRTSDAISIVEKCEARSSEAAKSLTKPRWKFW